MVRSGMRCVVSGMFWSSILWSAVAFGQGTTWDHQIEAGRMAYSQAQYDEAAKLFSAALQEAEKSGPEDARVATSLMELGQTNAAQKRYGEAEPLYRRALAIREKVLGPDHLDVAKTLSSLASLFYRVQNYPERAEPLLKRALAILEKNLGPEDPEVAGMLNSLAGRLREQGKFTEAEPLFLRSLAIREKVLGPEHADFVKSLLGIASFYAEQGKYTEAEPFYQRSLEILEKLHAYGSAYPNVPGVLNSYAQLLRKTNRESEAVEMETRAKTTAADPAQR